MIKNYKALLLTLVIVVLILTGCQGNTSVKNQQTGEQKTLACRLVESSNIAFDIEIKYVDDSMVDMTILMTTKGTPYDLYDVAEYFDEAYLTLNEIPGVYVAVETDAIEVLEELYLYIGLDLVTIDHDTLHETFGNGKAFSEINSDFSLSNYLNSLETQGYSCKDK